MTKTKEENRPSTHTHTRLQVVARHPPRWARPRGLRKVEGGKGEERQYDSGSSSYARWVGGLRSETRRDERMEARETDGKAV